MPLTDHFTKKVLTLFPTFYPCLQEPLLMADYITQCYDSKNSGIALLALHAIFKLMTGNFQKKIFW